MPTANIKNGSALGIQQLKQSVLLSLEHPCADLPAEARRVLIRGSVDIGVLGNVGGANGDTPSEIAAAISNEITSRATTAVLQNMKELAGQMGQDVTNLAEGFGVPVPGVVEEAAGFLQNLFK